MGQSPYPRRYGRGSNPYFIKFTISVFLFSCGNKKADRIKKTEGKPKLSIVKQHGTYEKVNAIFEKEGEAHFRAVEHEALKELLTKENVVVSAGGGTPCFFDNMELINASAQSVYLKVEPEMLLGRLKGATSKRPLLANLTSEELRLQISEKLAVREPFYMQSKIVHATKGSPNKDLADLVAILSH